MGKRRPGRPKEGGNKRTKLRIKKAVLTRRERARSLPLKWAPRTQSRANMEGHEPDVCCRDKCFQHWGDEHTSMLRAYLGELDKEDELLFLRQRTSKAAKFTTGRWDARQLARKPMYSHFLEKPQAVANLAGMPIHEVELLATPPHSKPQSKHRDTRHNLITFFVYLPKHGQLVETTWVCNDFALGCNPTHAPLERLKYYQPECPRGSSIMNHAARPHGGPGNSSSHEWRYVLFLSFPVDAESSRHWCDEGVYWW